MINKNIGFLLCLIYIFIFSKTQSQNLVPNPSFENYSTCPNSTAQIHLVSSWVSPSNGSPDYFNSCATNTFCDVPSNFFGTQVPRTGNAYTQIVTYPSAIFLREYVQVKLLSPLVAGQTYDVSFYTCLQDNSYRASNNIGIYISNIAPTAATMGPLPVVPQINETNVINDIINWRLISGTYTALGGEEYITIGNFYGDVSTSTAINSSGSSIYATFYLVEDVCVTPQGGTGCSTVLPIQLLDFYGENNGQNNQLYWKTSMEINNDYFSIERSKDGQSFYPIGKVKGAGNNSVKISYHFIDDNILDGINYYRLKQTDFNGDHTYSKTIALSRKLSNANVYPNPFINEFSISFHENTLFPVVVSVYNIAGQEVWSQKINNNKEFKASLKSHPKGVYLVKVENQETISFFKQLKK